jgi:hypothetical protein
MRRVFAVEETTPMSALSDQELNLLEQANSEDDWNSTCDTIKAIHNGYPYDWHQKVILSGFADRVAAKWGGTTKIHVVRILIPT